MRPPAVDQLVKDHGSRGGKNESVTSLRKGLHRLRSSWRRSRPPADTRNFLAINADSEKHNNQTGTPHSWVDLWQAAGAETMTATTTNATATDPVNAAAGTARSSSNASFSTHFVAAGAAPLS